MAGLLDDTSGFGGLLGNPLFNMGLGILAASGRPNQTFGGALGQGGLLGLQNAAQFQQAQALNQYRKLQGDLAKANLALKLSEAPKVETAFDPTGRETRMMWDPNQRKFVPLGGAKTDILTPEAEAQKVRIAQAGRASTTVNVGPTGIDYGKPPENMAWARNPDGTVALAPDPDTGFMRPVAVPVAGGPVELERQTQAEKERLQKEAQERQADIVLQDIDRALKTVDEASLPTTGMVGNLLSGVPGTGAHNLNRLLSTIKANVGFDKLQQMRNASPTGGALGQVSEFENRLLQSVLGDLEQSQSREQFEFNLRRLKNTYLDIIHGPGNGPPRVPLTGGAKSDGGWQDLGGGVRIRRKE